MSTIQWFKHTLTVQTRGKALYAFTQAIERQVNSWEIREGMCYLYIPHTSASLVISENYDPTAKQDLETYMEKAVPDDQNWMQHDMEGPDDSSAHIRAILTSTSLNIPIEDGRLALGMWQGVYLFEHRKSSQRREVYLRCLSIVNEDTASGKA
jgi:secondary thiamine-phosphate synthase enzyme